MNHCKQDNHRYHAMVDQRKKKFGSDYLPPLVNSRVAIYHRLILKKIKSQAFLKKCTFNEKLMNQKNVHSMIFGPNKNATLMPHRFNAFFIVFLS